MQRSPETTLSDAEIRDRLTQAVQTRLLEQNFNVTLLVQVTVLELLKRN